MYVEVAAVLPDTEPVLMIPATAVLYAPYGDSVFVLEEKRTRKTGAVGKVLNQKFVRLGPARGDFVVVASGLEAGPDRGQHRRVSSSATDERVVDNTLAPQPQLAPKRRIPDLFMKSLTDLFISRPVLAIVVNLVIISPAFSHFYPQRPPVPAQR